jgi:hypothetical protein
MKKAIFLLSLLIAGLSTQAQILEPIRGYGFSWNRGEFSVFLSLPAREDTLFSSTDRAKLRNGSAFFNTTDSTIWVLHNNKFRPIQGTGAVAVDSIKKSNDSVYYWKGGTRTLAFLDAGTTDGNNFPSSLSISGGTLTLARTGLSALTTPINTDVVPEGSSTLYFTVHGYGLL